MINEEIVKSLLKANAKDYLRAKYSYVTKLMNENAGNAQVNYIDRKYKYTIYQSACCAYEKDKRIEEFLISFLFTHEAPSLVLFLKRYKIDTTKYDHFAKYNNMIVEEELFNILLNNHEAVYNDIFLKNEKYPLNESFIGKENCELNMDKLNNLYTCLERALIEENETLINGYQRYPEYFKNTVLNLNWNSVMIEKLKLSYSIAEPPHISSSFKI